MTIFNKLSNTTTPSIGNITYTTDIKLNKKSRITKEPTPYATIRKVVKATDVVFGTSRRQLIIQEVLSEGLDYDFPFVAPKKDVADWKTLLTANIWAHKEKGSQYVGYGVTNKTKFQVIKYEAIDHDGVVTELSKEEVDAIVKEYGSQAKPSREKITLANGDEHELSSHYTLAKFEDVSEVEVTGEFLLLEEVNPIVERLKRQFIDWKEQQKGTL